MPSKFRTIAAEELLSRAIGAYRAGNFFEARSACADAIAKNKKNVPALHLLAVLEAQQKNSVDALRMFDRALNVSPRSADILADKGRVLTEIGRHEEALACYQQAVSINPQHWAAIQNQGYSLLALRRNMEALETIDRLLTIVPHHAPALNNRGEALKNLNRYEDAITSYKQALALDSRNIETWSNLGDCLHKLKHYDDALDAYRRILAINPVFDGAWLGYANVVSAMKRFDDALSAYDKALEINGNLAEAWLGRANVFFELKRYDDALNSYQKALALQPDLTSVEASCLHTKMHICNWTNFHAENERLMSSVRNGTATAQPFIFLTLASSVANQFRCAKKWASDNCPSQPKPDWQSDKREHDRIRIGFLTSDFREHATSYLSAGMFESYDKSRFEIIAISWGGNDHSAIRRRIETSSDRFVDVQTKTDSEIAAIVRELRIDIAVDMMGYIKDSRPNIFARRCAPIQASYLAYPGTIGADFMDYIIADRIVAPECQYDSYSEKIVTLPNSYQVNDAKRPISDRSFTRHELGLPETGIVFCCFNNNYKITPDIFDCWMRLLRRVDESVLWLLEDNVTAASNLRKEASDRGVVPDRIIFAERMPQAEHLSRHRLADLFLDTLPYNAHTTASDALWAGVPILTCRGRTFAGRVAASLLNAVQLPELVTTTMDDYERLAVELATNPEKLADVKVRLARNRQTAALFDTKLFTRHLEAAFTTMYARHHAGLGPDHFVVSPQTT